MLATINNRLTHAAVATQTAVADRLRRRDGQTSTEYLIVILVVAIVGFVVWRVFGRQISSLVKTQIIDTVSTWNG